MASAFDGAVVFVCPCAATTTVANSPAVPIATKLKIFMARFFRKVPCRGPESLVQQRIELSPNVIFFCVGLMAIGAFRLRFQFGGWSFGLMMIEIVVAPSSGIGMALGILDGHISAIPSSGKISSP